MVVYGIQYAPLAQDICLNLFVGLYSLTAKKSLNVIQKFSWDANDALERPPRQFLMKNKT